MVTMVTGAHAVSSVKTCKGCGNPFTPSHGLQVRCRRGCGRYSAKAQRHPDGRFKRNCARKLVPCPRCATPFWPWAKNDHSRKFCSRGCAFPVRIPKAPIEPRECVWCLQSFTPAKNTPQACCSKTCRQRYQSKRRKLRLKSLAPATITVAHLFRRGERDCALCGEPVDRTHKYPHPMAATVDHRVPITKGGEHHLDNVQLAHARCNTSKGNRVAA